MPNNDRTYIAIDLKSFYASVECVERGLDPLSAYLVVADEERTDKTICLAVSPALKAFGIPGRARLFEVKKHLRDLYKSTGQQIEPVIARPRMQLYMDYSNRINAIYASYVSPEDIHIYSVDEVFIDVTSYLPVYKMTAHELTIKMIRAVLRETGITATAGIGTNMYLAKVAMDIVAKHVPADADGVRIAELNERTYREQLWNHRPLTSFWRVGRGIAARLEQYGIDTMGKLARASIEYGEWLYRQFGVNAELLIDHAWGYEPCTMEAIKNYHSATHSLSNGQVLSTPYTFDKARTVALEMADAASMRLVRKGLLTDQLILTVNYDRASIEPGTNYHGEVARDYYGRRVPKQAHGSINLGQHTASTQQIMSAVSELFDRIVDPTLLVRRLNITTNNVISLSEVGKGGVQLDLFAEQTSPKQNAETESKLQKALLEIKSKYGNNAILRGTNFGKGATGRERNAQIGGHRA